MKVSHRFAALSAMSFGLKIVGIVLGVFGVMGALRLSADSTEAVPLAAVLFVLGGFLSAFLCFIASECIEVALAIEKHARETREGVWTLLRDLRHD